MRLSRFHALSLLPSLVFLFFLGFLPATPAWSTPPPACAPEIVGPWSGKVWDQGRLKDLDTTFSVKSGELTGIYRVHDDEGGYEGTLTDFTPSGPCAGLFHWHDRHGDGVVSVVFRPDRDRFDGEWGTVAPLENYVFNGRRFRPAPTS